MENLQEIAKQIRRDVVTMIYHAKSGHPGGSLSCVDILTCLYHELMNIQLDEKGKRIDKLVLSKGHAAPAYYAELASVGFIPKEELMTLRKTDSLLEGHPSIKINGVDSSSGSLGQGLSIANGMALAKKIDHQEGYVYCILGDGELEEGQIWEACMSAHKFELSNLIIFVDNNHLQIDGTILDVKSVDNIEQKFQSFGFFVQTIDGHNMNEIIQAVQKAKNSQCPNVVIAKTVKGKGVSFMENQVKWHGRALSDDEYRLAMEELK